MIRTLADSASEAANRFCVYTNEKPAMVSTGIPFIDNACGGLIPGQVGILAAATKVGKSSLMLRAALDNDVKTGIVSCEDAEAMMGSRILSHFSGVNSQKFFTNAVSSDERKRLKDAQKKMASMDNVLLSYQVGRSLEDVLDATEALFEAGCRLVWLDYIQKIKGVTDDRRNEVSRVFTSFHAIVGKYNGGGMALSQFRREVDPTRKPGIYHLKESGDLENEAKLIVLGYQDASDSALTRWTVGANGMAAPVRDFSYRRNAAGVLEPEYRTTFEQVKPVDDDI